MTAGSALGFRKLLKSEIQEETKRRSLRPLVEETKAWERFRI
jgi:hypothetical protein